MSCGWCQGMEADFVIDNGCRACLQALSMAGTWIGWLVVRTGRRAILRLGSGLASSFDTHPSTTGLERQSHPSV